jgi:hypothetical protein
MRLAGEKCVQNFWLGSLKGSDHWKDPGVDGRIIFLWLLDKYILRVWIGLIWFRIGAGGGFL